MKDDSFVLGYAIKWYRGDREEMKAYKDLVEKMFEKNGAREDRMLSLLEAFAVGQKDNLKKLVQPIGRTCNEIHLNTTDAEQSLPVLDQAFKEAVLSNKDEITEEQVWDILMSELDLQTGSCKITLVLPENDETQIQPQPKKERISAKITDPVLMLANNAYAVAFAGKTPIRIKAKSLIRDGKICKLFISNIHKDES